jgi:hypothetical protein
MVINYRNYQIRFNPYLVLLLFLFGSTACNSGATGTPVPVAKSGSAIGVEFREFYDFLGGEEALGSAISDVLVQNGVYYQFVPAGVLVYDPVAPVGQRFRLAPLGLELKLKEPPLPEPAEPDIRYVDGHYIATEFLTAYEKLGGRRMVGRPLTEARFNPEVSRYEQYFENLGFYRLEGDDPDRVRLLAYGLWKCGDVCNHADENSVDFVPQIPDVKAPFSDMVAELGSDFTGFNLSGTYTARDGLKEMVFTNVVMVIDAANPRQILLRPLGQMFGDSAKVMSQPTNQPGWVFVPVSEGLGFNIPPYFDAYLKRHGGLAISGLPIQEPILIDHQTTRQCFVNICLDYETNKPAEASVSPVYLGYLYKEKYPEINENTKFPLNTQVPTPIPNLEAASEIVMQVSAGSSLVTSEQEQEIWVNILDNGMPMQNAKPILLVTLPDGTQQAINFHPTGSNGRASVRVQPVRAMSGTLIPFQVCMRYSPAATFCVKDDYLIWNNP